MKKSRLFLFLPLFVLATVAVSHLAAQETDPDGVEAVEPEAPAPIDAAEYGAAPTAYAEGLSATDDDRVYVIAAFELDIKGRTRPGILMHDADLKVGERLSGMAGLEEYIRDRTRVLTNMRVLKDTVELTYSVGGIGADGSYPVTVFVKVEDTWNIIAIPPLPFFNTNTGMDVTLKARDYNFLGTMRPLRVDLGYHRDKEQNDSFDAIVELNIPFTAWGRNWNYKFENTFMYRPKEEEAFYFRNVTGLSVDLPFRATTFTVGFDEAVTLNDENPEGDWEKYGRFQGGAYMSSTAFVSWSIPTGLKTENYGELSYVMTPSATFNHEMPGSPIPDSRRGPFLAFSHSLGFGRVDWHGNFRRGLSASLGNSSGYDFFRMDSGLDPFSTNLSFTGTVHFIMNDFIGFSARIQSRQWFYFDDRGSYDNGGDALRGIPDDQISTDAMLSINTNIPIRAFRFMPSRWFGSSRMRIFDFEFHVSPMLDLAIYNEPRDGGRNVAAAGGLEFMVFPNAMRSIYLRFSAGVNVFEFLKTKRIPGGGNREFSFGMGHFF